MSRSRTRAGSGSLDVARVVTCAAATALAACSAPPLPAPRPSFPPLPPIDPGAELIVRKPLSAVATTIALGRSYTGSTPPSSEVAAELGREFGVVVIGGRPSTLPNPAVPGAPGDPLVGEWRKTPRNELLVQTRSYRVVKTVPGQTIGSCSQAASSASVTAPLVGCHSERRKSLSAGCTDHPPYLQRSGWEILGMRTSAGPR